MAERINLSVDESSIVYVGPELVLNNVTCKDLTSNGVTTKSNSMERVIDNVLVEHDRGRWYRNG